MPRYLSAEEAQRLDRELMDPASGCGFTLAQLMELAGLSVAQVVHDAYPSLRRILVVAGAGNNGGDGLVAARHLALYGYHVSVVYPKAGQSEFFQMLQRKCSCVGVSVCEDLSEELLGASDVIVDALFGFSFDVRRPLRDPFASIIARLSTACQPIVCVDVPSGWDVDCGPASPDVPHIKPAVLISLTAPKGCARHLGGEVRHYLGGRFVPPTVASAYRLSLPDYPGAALFCRLS